MNTFDCCNPVNYFMTNPVLNQQKKKKKKKKHFHMTTETVFEQKEEMSKHKRIVFVFDTHCLISA